MLELEIDSMFESRFRIVRKLGEGGFGVVYEAFDAPLNRSVAIKLLKPSTLSDGQVRRRFLREGKILSGLQSDRLVRLYSVNVSSDGLLYMVMELVSGQTLRALLIERTRLSEASTLAIARSMVLALKVLQTADVVHRDLKPDNVMLLNGSETHIKLLDFGLSGLLSKNVINDSQVTSEGAMIGSVHYMAPELCTGQRATIRTDFYALGCILYECLTGSPPFAAQESTAVILKHVSEMPPDPALMESGISPSTSRFLLQLLQKNPSLRFQSCDQILKILDSSESRETTTQVRLHTLVPFGASANRKSASARKLRSSLVMVTLLTLSVLICLLVAQTRPESNTFSSPSTFKIGTLVSTLSNDLLSPSKLEDYSIGEVAVSESDTSEFSRKWQKLLTLLREPDRGQNRYLLPETLSEVRNLADELIKAQRWKSAVTLLRETLNYVASEQRIRSQQISILIAPIVMQMAAHTDELTQKEFLYASGPVLDALSARNLDNNKDRLFVLLQLSKAKYPSRRIISDARLDKALSDCAEQMPVKDLTIYREDFQRLANHCDARLERLDTQLVEITRTLIRIDKESTAEDREALLGQDYLFLARGYKKTNTREAQRYSAASLAAFTKYGVMSPQWIQSLTESAIINGSTNESRALLLQAEQNAKRLSGGDHYTSLNYILLGWHHLHAPHVDERFSCADGKQVIHLVREMAKASKSDLERQSQCCWLLSVAQENHVPKAEIMKNLKEGTQALMQNPNFTSANIFVLKRRKAQLLTRYGDHSMAVEHYKSLNRTPEYQPFIDSDRQLFVWELASALKSAGHDVEALETYASLPNWKNVPSFVAEITSLREKTKEGRKSGASVLK